MLTTCLTSEECDWGHPSIELHLEGLKPGAGATSFEVENRGGAFSEGSSQARNLGLEGAIPLGLGATRRLDFGRVAPCSHDLSCFSSGGSRSGKR